MMASEEFVALCELTDKNFGGIQKEKLNDCELIDRRVTEGVYDKNPDLFASDIDQFWNKIQTLGADIVTTARSLSDRMDKSCKQIFLSVSSGHCGGRAEDAERLICGLCEEIQHLSCILPILEEIPSGGWCCGKCLPTGFGAPSEF